MISLAILVALAQDGSGSGAPAPDVYKQPETTSGFIGVEEPTPLVQPTSLSLAPKPSPIRRTKPSGPTTEKYFPENTGVTCEATLAVDKEGKTTSVTMLSGVDDCPEPFQKACMRSMKYWKFLPAQMDGRAIASEFKAKVTFHKDGTVDGADAK
jgi:hypothetical protein